MENIKLSKKGVTFPREFVCIVRSSAQMLEILERNLDNINRATGIMEELEMERIPTLIPLGKGNPDRKSDMFDETY